MKEKETATCPICGGELQTQGKALFKEHHKRLWEKKCKEYGIEPHDGYEGCFGKMFYCQRTTKSYGNYKQAPKDKPAELIRWEAENPIPDVDLIGFIVSLAKRLAGLDEKKGGSR